MIDSLNDGQGFGQLRNVNNQVQWLVSFGMTGTIAPVAVIFRKTLAKLGTRTGERQLHRKG